MTIKNKIMWEERKMMTNFLYEKGWMLSFKELEDVIKEFKLEEDYGKWRKTKNKRE